MRKNRIAVVAFAAVIIVGCVRQQEPQVVREPDPRSALESPARDIYAIGTVLTPEGAVSNASAANTISRGGPIYVSVNVTGASAPPVVEVVWCDPSGVVLHQEKKQAGQSSPFVFFETGDTSTWSSGHHVAEIFVNERKVAERGVDVL